MLLQWCCYTHWFSGLLCCCYMLVFNARNSVVCIPSFILFEKTNRGRIVWFYVLCCCCYTMGLSGFIMVWILLLQCSYSPYLCCTQVSFWHWLLWLFDWFFCLKAYAENWFCVPWYTCFVYAQILFCRIFQVQKQQHKQTRDLSSSNRGKLLNKMLWCLQIQEESLKTLLLAVCVV